MEFLSNTFTGNSGTKGIIFLQLPERKVYPVVFGSNTFTKNAGYMDSNVIFIRAKGTSVTTATPNTNSNLFCSGYHFESNVFTNNFGCSRIAGGVIRFECVDSTASPADNSDRYTMPTISSAVGTSYCNSASSVTASTVSSTYNSIAYAADLNRI